MPRPFRPPTGVRSLAGPGSAISELEARREQIAGIDLEILALMAARVAAARGAGQAKRAAGEPLRDWDAERRVLDRAAARAAELGLPPARVRELMQVLIAASRDEQEWDSYTGTGGTAEQIAVIGGRGRMGAWLARFLENQGHRVAVYDRGDGVDVGDASLALIATPQEAIPGVLADLAGRGYRGVACDVSSLKSHLAGAIADARERGMSVTSLHPMFGPDARTLSDRVVAVCDCGDPAATARVRALFADTAATIVELTLEEHDRVVSYVLGLSHLLNLVFARVLMAAGGSYDDLARIGSTTFHSQMVTTATVLGDNPDLYFSIQSLNPFSPELYTAVRSELDTITSWVAEGDREAFAALMRRGVDWLRPRPEGDPE